MKNQNIYVFMLNLFAWNIAKIISQFWEYQSIQSTAPAATKNSTDIWDNFTNTLNARTTSSQNIFNTLQPGSREEAVSGSNQDITITGTAVSFGHLLLGKFEESILQDYILLFASWDRDCWSNSNEESKSKDNFHVECLVVDYVNEKNYWALNTYNSLI